MKLFCQQGNELEISVIHTDTHFYKFQLNIVSSVQTVIVFIIIHMSAVVFWIKLKIQT